MIKQISGLALLIGLLHFSSTPKSSDALFARTDAYVEKIADSLEIVGLNYAILIDNEIVHTNSYGLANAQLEVAMNLEHRFPVASISKLFSSIALYKLLDIHERSVDEPVAAFLGEREDLPKAWQELSLKQLLSHSSGIPDQIDYGIYLAPESDEFVIEALKDKAFSSSPGTESRYNATGFLLIRMIIESLAKQDFGSYMQNEYFEKLGLSSAKYGGFKKVVPKRVTCYQNRNGALEMFPLNYSSPMYAGAGLNISIGDLLKWFQALQSEQILSRRQLEEIWTPVPLADGTDGHFGLGWEAYKLPEGYRMVGHGGAGISSFRHYWNEETNKNVTVVLLSNGAMNWSISANQINAQIANMVLE